MTLDRSEFLARLLMVQPGLSRRKSIAQSDCVVMRRGRFYTLSQEVACAVESGLPHEFDGAVNAAKLLEAVKKMPDEALDVALEDRVLVLRSGGRTGRARISLEADTLLPVDDVEKPREWLDLPQEFAEAAELVAACTRTRRPGEDGAFLFECVHVNPHWLEASDNRHLARYCLEVPVEEPALIRGETILAIKQVRPEKVTATPNWLHFGSGTGLRVSLRKFALEDYPDLSPFLKMRGRRVTLPQTLERAAALAMAFSADELVSVRLGEKGLVVKGESGSGEYVEKVRLSYAGPDLRFRVPGKLLAAAVTRFGEVEVGPSFLRAGTDAFTYMTSLMPEDGREPQTDRKPHPGEDARQGQNGEGHLAARHGPGEVPIRCRP